VKKAFIVVILFYLGFHFIIPELYSHFVDNVHVYSDLVDKAASNKAFWINIIPVGLVGLTIYLLPNKDYFIPPAIQNGAATELFYIAMAYKAFFIIMVGGFSGIISGEMSGAFLNYINLFLSPIKLLMCALFLQKKKSSALIMILTFIVVSTFAGSRAAILSVFTTFLIGIAFENFYYYKKKIFLFLKYAFIISPVLFIYATQLRYGADYIDYKTIGNLIMGRVSFIELGMIPIHYYDDGGLDLSLFYEKYGFIHQTKLIIDSLIPGDIFGFDVMPNNYFRSIFMGYTEEFVTQNYMSMNITLPVYFYMLFGYLGVFFTYIYVMCYFFVCYMFRKFPFVVLLLLATLYETLLYFDWVMVFSQFFTGVLTILVLKGYIVVRESFKREVKRVHEQTD
jgi:hypothetical protein